MILSVPERTILIFISTLYSLVDDCIASTKALHPACSNIYILHLLGNGQYLRGGGVRLQNGRGGGMCSFTKKGGRKNNLVMLKGGRGRKSLGVARVLEVLAILKGGGGHKEFPLLS